MTITNNELHQRIMKVVEGLREEADRLAVGMRLEEDNLSYSLLAAEQRIYRTIADKLEEAAR